MKGLSPEQVNLWKIKDTGSFHFAVIALLAEKLSRQEAKYMVPGANLYK